MRARIKQLGDELTAILEEERRAKEAEGIEVAWPPPPAPGWAHLPIIAIDLVFNLGRNYDRVVRPAIDRYAHRAADSLRGIGSAEELTQAFSATRRPGHQPHTIDESLGLLNAMSTQARKELFACRNLRAFRRANAPYRADTVVMAMENIREIGLQTGTDLHVALESEPGAVRRAVQRTPGLGSAAWAYLPLLVDQDSVKRDVHVDRFLSERLSAPLSDDEIRPVFRRACDAISEGSGARCTVRGLEHFIWRMQSGRPPRTGA